MVEKRPEPPVNTVIGDNGDTNSQPDFISPGATTFDDDVPAGDPSNDGTTPAGDEGEDTLPVTDNQE